MPKRKIAIIGLGDIAQKAYLPILATDPDLELILLIGRKQHYNESLHNIIWKKDLLLWKRCWKKILRLHLF